MVEVSVEGDKAVFTVLGWDKLWALRSRLGVPLAHGSDVHADASPKVGWSQGLKLVGAACRTCPGGAPSTRTAAGCSGTCGTRAG